MEKEIYIFKMDRQTILIFGNTLVESDSLAVKLIPKLKKTFKDFNFIHVDPTENLEIYGKDLIIVDVIQNIKEPIIITDIKKLKLPNVNSMHDFDLSYNLKLLMQVKKINSVKILGLPHNIEENKAIEWIKNNL